MPYAARMGTTRKMLTLPATLWHRIKVQAAMENVPVRNIVQRALSEYLERSEVFRPPGPGSFPR